MADITTFWDVANARGDWLFTNSVTPAPIALATDPDDSDVIETEGGLILDIEGILLPSAVDLVGGHDLETAVLISLFTDRTADPADVIPDGTTDPRGWWGDAGETYPIGSRIWLLDKAKATQATLNLAKDAITEALQWLLDDGVAAAVDVFTEYTRPGVLGALITVRQPVGPSQSFAFNWVWSAL